MSRAPVTRKAFTRRRKRIRARSGRRKRVSPWVVWVLGLPSAALLGGLLHISGHGPFHALLESLEQEVELEEDLVRLKEQNELLQEDIDDLMPGEFGIEKRARERLGWSKPGEIVVHMPHKK